MFWNMFLPIHEKEHLFSRLHENTHIKKINYRANGALCDLAGIESALYLVCHMATGWVLASQMDPMDPYGHFKVKK